MGDIFVSHSSTDADVALRLKSLLSDAGYKSIYVSTDPENNTRLGKRWLEDIADRLARCRVVISILSPAAASSNYCFYEAITALGSGKAMIQVFIEPHGDWFTWPFNALERIDLSDDREAAEAKIVRDILEIAPVGESAFPGLRPFPEASAAFFHGREKETTELIEQLAAITGDRHESGLLIAGASGCGKSSLLRAGVIPALRSTDPWIVVGPIRPVKDGIEGLTRAFQAAFYACGASEVIVDLDDWDPGSDPIDRVGELCAELVQVSGKPDGQVVVAIDQLEELLLPAAADQVPRFRSLLSPWTPGRRLTTIATIRSDALDQVNRLVELEPHNASFPLETLDEDGIRAAVIGPCNMLGIEVEPTLLDRIVGDCRGQNVLSSLALTLSNLHDASGQGMTWRERSYDDVGGVIGSLRRRAEEAHRAAEMIVGESVVRRLFLAMVSLTEHGEAIKQPVPKGELDQKALQILERFVDRRLLVSGTSGGRETVEVVHDVLFKEWDTLRAWIDDEKSQLETLRDLRVAAERWASDDRPQDQLWGPSLLARVDQLEAVPNVAEQRQFIEQSRRRVRHTNNETERKNRQLRWRAIAAAVLAVAAFVGAVVAGLQWQDAIESRDEAEANRLEAEANRKEADDQRGVAEARGREVRVQALDAEARATVNVNPALAMALSIESISLGDQVTERQRQTHYDTFAAMAEPGQPVWTLDDHDDRVWAVAHSPDGRVLATAGDDQRILLRNGDDGEVETAIADIPGEIRDLAFSRDSTMVAATGIFRGAMVFDIESGGMIHHLIDETPASGWAVAFSPTAELVAVGNRNGTIGLWDTKTGERIERYSHGEALISALAFNSDGTHMASSDFAGEVVVWDLVEGTKVVTLEGHSSKVSAVAFPPDRDLLLSVGDDETMRLWNFEGASAIIRGHTNTVVGLAVSPDGKTVATASNDQTVRLWDFDRRQTIAVLDGHGGWVRDVEFSPDGTSLTSVGTDATVRRWRAISSDLGPIIRDQAHRPFSLVASPDGRRFATGGANGGLLQWDPETARVIVETEARRDWLRRPAYSPDGNFLAVPGNDGRVEVVSATTGEVLTAFEGHREATAVWAAEFSPDGDLVASVGDDEVVRIWSATTGRAVKVLDKLHQDPIYAIAWASDGETLITGSVDRSLIVWDAGGETEPDVLGHHDGWVWQVAVSPDGKTLASVGADGRLKLWDLDRRELVLEIDAHDAPALSVVFSSDGSMLATTSDDHTVRLWRSDGEPIVVLNGHTDTTWSAAFILDDQLVATTGSDGTIRLNPILLEDGSLDFVALCAEIAEYVTTSDVAAALPDGATPAGCTWP